MAVRKHRASGDQRGGAVVRLVHRSRCLMAERGGGKSAWVRAEHAKAAETMAPLPDGRHERNCDDLSTMAAPLRVRCATRWFTGACSPTQGRPQTPKRTTRDVRLWWLADIRAIA
ncbi:hypothetical protein SPHINGO8AM_150009 [Sphingomonas sp. 8AM]|nr:hypothetical protein SPHINGO8AM_150009 [Sphingomonas sp. 8AM]